MIRSAISLELPEKVLWPMSIMSVVMKELEQYYKVLGLEYGASLEEVNQAYRDLAFIWHPDRIPKNNQRLLEKAVAKLQEINHACEQLRLIQTNQSQPSPKSASKPTSPRTEKGTPPPHYQPRTEKRTSPPHYQTQRPYYGDLSQADLRGANLREKDLSGRNLRLADLSQADLTDSFLHKVNLESANLYRANLFRANLLQANLRRANLQEANLIGADLSGADLSEADLRGAKISSGNRIMVKLTGVILKGTILPDGTIHT